MTKLWISLGLLIATSAHGITVVGIDTDFKLTTDKVATVKGAVGPKLAKKFLAQMKATANLPGDRLILIDSPGGYTVPGQAMIDAILAEEQAGVKVVCLVLKSAHSMAFNFLTRCDVRLAAPNAMMLVHKVAWSELPTDGRATAENMRRWADEIERADEPYRWVNLNAMKLSVEDYEAFAAKDTIWKAKTLRTRGYLHGLARIQK